MSTSIGYIAVQCVQQTSLCGIYTDIVNGSTWVLDVRAVGNQTFRVRKVIHNGPMGIQLLHNSELVVVSEHPSESVLIRRVAPECSLSGVVRGRKYILFAAQGKSEDDYSLVGGPLPRSKKLVKSIKALLSEHYGKPSSCSQL